LLSKGDALAGRQRSVFNRKIWWKSEIKQAGAVKSESRDLVIRNSLASLQFARLRVDVPKGQTCVFLNQKDDNNPATR
jgi:hypothetical protein